MKGEVHYDVRDGVAVLRVDNPPVNPLSSGVRQGLYDGVERAIADNAVEAVVLTGEGRAFIAGADISEFGQAANQGASLSACLQRMEDAPKPVVAALNGTAFGGGLEVALCAHYRVAAPAAQVGLPEVKLGLLPGAGGTQRLPRLIGAKAALDFILSGEGVAGPRAKTLGIVDEVFEGDLLEQAIAYARDLAARGAKLRKIADEDTVIARDREHPEIFENARAHIERRMRGKFAPEMIVQCVEAAVHAADFDNGLRTEQARFRQCLEHPQREALIHVFFAERQTAKIPDVPKDTAERPVQTAAVIGCGTMGGGIAMNFVNAGIPVTILEANDEALEKGLGVIRKNYERTLERGGLSRETLEHRMQLISTTNEYERLRGTDMVIEAVYENIELKEEIFSKLDAVMKPRAVLATNTSGLDVDRIAQATSRPADVVGMHFFSPANVMRLLEVVRGKETAKDVIATAMAAGKRMGKVAVLAGNCPGFIGNRMLGGYTRQAGELIMDGAAPWDVDRVLYQFGLNMGPFQMNDLVGLDLGWRARKMNGTPREQMPPAARVADDLCELGRYGQKTGRGYYIYDAGVRQGQPDPEVLDIVAKVAGELGRERREVSDDEILKRCLYALVNEGARILDEGIALRASDLDIVYINGYGFPDHQGGPMFWADQQGLDNVLRDILSLHQEHGEFWQPAPLLKRLAEEGKGFSSVG